ncbi:MAG TPA: hypothetical protein ENI87_13600, partial [bacterium]|nr:hypothetical protein [bacterium]
MQRQHTLALVLVFAAVIAGLGLWFGRGESAPPSSPPPAVEPPPEVAQPEGAAVHADLGRANATLREAAAPPRDPVFDDPEIQEGLCGFRGRVVDHRKVPVADCGVRLYRGALDSLLRAGPDLFRERSGFEPQFIAGETRTGGDGEFLIRGVWPRGVYMLFAGIGTDAPTHQVVTEVPSPGEVVDLGDVVLNDAGVITGVVVDEDGDPLAGALVRAADIPGTLAAFFPAERLDPEGALLIRERSAPVQVVEMPAWVRRVFEHLPIPSTTSGSDGRFRLVGVVPGSNMLATTARGFLSDVKPSVLVRAGSEKDVGRIRMRRGEELVARVVDEKGEPVPGAEVLAGSTISMVPFDLASRVGETDGEGYVEATGFSPGNVTVAARRSRSDDWVLAEPQSIIRDVVVTLPAHYAVTVVVQRDDGTPVDAPNFRLLRGRSGDGAAELFLLGFVEPVSLVDRLHKRDDGRWQITDLAKGRYTLLANAAGLATGSTTSDIAGVDAEATVKLAVPTRFSVVVLDSEERPIRNAAVFAEPRGRSIIDMPVNCGRTDATGRLLIDDLEADSLRISAEHPRWGVVNGEVKKDEELVLHMQAPGTLRGELSENGKPPLPGKFTVAVLRQRNGGPRGPLESVPQLVTATGDGRFEVARLQPGSYSVAAVTSLDILRSPGAMFALGKAMYATTNVPVEHVDVASGEVSLVRIEVGEQPLEGPTATLHGTVMVNGRAAEGYLVTAWLGSRRLAATVDPHGRFDFGLVSAGVGNVQVLGGELVFGRSALWESAIELQEAESRELTIDIAVTTVAGICLLPDGSPAAGMSVRMRGKTQATGGSQGSVSLRTRTVGNGRFRFEQVPAGVYELEVSGRSGEERWRGRLEGVEVEAGVPLADLRVPLESEMVVRGRLDFQGLPDGVQWGRLTFHRLQARDPTGAKGQSSRSAFCQQDRPFVVHGLEPGRYRVSLRTYGDGGAADYECGE